MVNMSICIDEYKVILLITNTLFGNNICISECGVGGRSGYECMR